MRMEHTKKIIVPKDYLPGNPDYPLLIYKQAVTDCDEKTVQTQLEQNDWRHAWVDSIYDFHHYHCNTHEVLVILSGTCQVQFGGDDRSIYAVNQGDVVIIPAGVAHKSLSMSDDFRCMGAYPFDVGHDMNYGTIEEYTKAIDAIKQVGLPKKDPILGEEGLLFKYWGVKK